MISIMMNKYYNNNNNNEYEVLITGKMKVFPVSYFFLYIFLMFDIIVMMKTSPDSCSA